MPKSYYYSGDPYWLNAKIAGTCKKCGGPFERGERIFYYPRYKTAYSGKCAEQASREFEAAAQDEFYGG